MSYKRVLPRDLFNEAKLLKCMGRLCLKIEDELTPVKMSLIFDRDTKTDGFKIGLQDSGDLFIENLSIFINNTRIDFFTTYNSKSNYPFHANLSGEEVEVFDDEGEFTDEFKDFCAEIPQGEDSNEEQN